MKDQLGFYHLIIGVDKQFLQNNYSVIDCYRSFKMLINYLISYEDYKFNIL